MDQNPKEPLNHAENTVRKQKVFCFLGRQCKADFKTALVLFLCRLVFPTHTLTHTLCVF